MQTESRLEWGPITLSLLGGWEWSSDGNGLSLFRPDGVGAVQISILARDPKRSSQAGDAVLLALKCARDRRWTVDDSQVHMAVIGGCPAAEFSVVESDAYWHVWHVVGQQNAAFVTYTCDAADADTESLERKSIVESLRWR